MPSQYARKSMEDSATFLSRLEVELYREEYEGVGVVVYMSPTGDSPLDMNYNLAFVFPDKFVVDRTRLDSVSRFITRVYVNSIKIFEKDVLGEINVTDYGNVVDGRFNSWDPRVVHTFKFGRPRFYGTNYTDVTKYEYAQNATQRLIRDKLRQARRDILLHDHYRTIGDHSSIVSGFNDALDSAFFVPRLLEHFSGYKYHHSPNSLGNSVDLVIELERAVGQKNIFDVRHLNPDSKEFFDIWSRSVAVFEGFVKDYIERFPLVQPASSSDPDGIVTSVVTGTFFMPATGNKVCATSFGVSPGRYVLSGKAVVDEGEGGVDAAFDYLEEADKF